MVTTDIVDRKNGMTTKAPDYTVQNDPQNEPDLTALPTSFGEKCEKNSPTAIFAMSTAQKGRREHLDSAWRPF